MINVQHKSAWESGPIVDNNIFKAIEFNSIYDEIKYVIEIEGLVLDGNEINQLNEAIELKLSNYALLGHNHDDRYALKNHNHDDRYSKLGHNHDDRYALIVHYHDDRYALKNHTHEGSGGGLNVQSQTIYVDSYQTPVKYEDGIGDFDAWYVRFYKDIPISSDIDVNAITVMPVKVLPITVVGFPDDQYNPGEVYSFTPYMYYYDIFSTYVRVSQFYLFSVTFTYEDSVDPTRACNNFLALPSVGGIMDQTLPSFVCNIFYS